MLKEIPNHPGYSITRDGRVWSERCYGRWLKPWFSLGYPTVGLYIYDKQIHYTIARLVLTTYVGPCPNGMECRHLDGNRLNSKLNNLCWGTRTENSQDATHHGTQVYGEKVGNSKLTNEQVKEIRKSLHNGVTQIQLAIYFQVDQATISNIHRQKTYSRVRNYL